MFSIDPNIADLKVKERNIFKILYSMNSHPVAMPGYASEDARCYILFFSEGPNLSSFIGLYLSRVDKKFFYRYTSNPFPFEAENDVESEARAFAEEMGFLLDEINVGGMAAEDRNTWIEEQFIFGYRTPESAEAGPDSAKQDAAAPQKSETVAAPVTAAPVDEFAPETPANLEVIHEEVAAPQPAQPQQQPAQQQMPPQGYPAYPPQPVPQGQQPAPGYPPAQQAYQPPYPPQQPGQPYGQPPQDYPAYPPQQPVPQGYPPAAQPPVVEEPLVPPELEHPEEPAEPAEAPSKPKAKPAPVQHRVPPKKKSPPQAAQPRASAVEKIEEELPVDLEYEAPEQRPRSLFEEAIKEGVVKPPKPKVARTGAHSPTGVVSRDKEALARLLASF